MTNGASIRTTDYLDGFQYNQLLLEFFPHAEGYVKATNTGFTPGNPNYAFNYVYNYTDHLGNVRLSYAKDPQTGNLKILDESHYYPFGLKHQEYQASSFTTNPIQGVIIAPVANNPFKYKYNGKEWQDELGLNFYDYGARNYDPALGRWMNMDPLAEKYLSYSPNSYVVNNPIIFIDIDGRDIILQLGVRYKKGKKLVPQALEGRVSAKLDHAMRLFAKTSYGEKFLLSFMKKGDTVFGLTAKEDGKHHNQKLTIFDGEFKEASDTERGLFFIGEKGKWDGLTQYFNNNEHNGYDLKVSFDTAGSIESLLGIIAHEWGLHLYNFDEVNDQKKKGKRKESSMDSEHDALKRKDCNEECYNMYENILNALKYQLRLEKQKTTYEGSR